MYINKVMLFGNLTRDPELRALPSGMNVVNFSVATNRTYKDRDGKKQEQTEFHNVVVFGRQADTVNQYLKKGSSVYVEGRLQTRSWEKDGEKKYRTEVVADRVQFGPKGSGSGARSTAGSGDDQTPPEDTTSGGGSGIEYPKDDINPDDIPF
ncbi:single-stranded DNA-binding protein [Candidatus Kaiserbacteria bacterium RIFCSPHIGHO2_02_FULL_55_20]|uniref:Single-stranded DNA-binding protein n=1 Tax=Candidatus Kaiserbacteria bacterium RIFCSPHIGHO2_02_FULL_55_20 TaxID=1798497 RepID=A0A1F6DZ83_9BACT|nr:MAG: single-stranded DNA-binding protein [Candidatus Kaiserbacteria bacterium RIFCSPHIGHO2_01_FULL_55_37]OGG66312.1 MAG: single-stranded DNA-binding protein [Candidatus Kaiserbacteria bacterium RIFCSPHIGHO2_02_FULL_55_20]